MSAFTPTSAAPDAADVSTFVSGAAPDSSTFTPDAADAGAVAAAEVEAIPGSSVSAKEYVEDHPGLFDTIRRKLWLDNDTPKPVFDKNEQLLHLGGKGYSGIDADGNFVFTMKHMTPDGSYHSGLSVDAQKLADEGKLKLLLSMTRDTQNQVIEVPIDVDGNAIIDPDSDVGKLLFEEVDGKMDFKGKFAEIAEYVGDDKDGVHGFRILATHVEDGDGLGEVPVEPVLPIEPVAPPRPEILPEGPDDILPEDVPIEEATNLPWVIPAPWRQPLEKMQKEVGPLPIYPYYGAGSAENILENFRERNLELDPYKVVKKDGKIEFFDKDGKIVQRDAEREKERIERYIDSLDGEYHAEIEGIANTLEPMNEKCRVAVIIPARYEEKNLANLLDQYSKQTDTSGNALDPDLFEINIIVNRKQSEIADNSVQVINDWRKDHPEIHVNIIDVAFKDEEACVGLARKYVTDATLLRSVKRKDATKPLYIESEDADLFSVDKATVAKLINIFDNRPHVDVLRGVQDRQPEVMKENELLFFQRRLWDLAEILLRNPKYRPDKNSGADFVWHRVVSGGWNTAFTAEAYAQIGGYGATYRIGEDMAIGQQISVLRGSKENGQVIPNTYTATTSGIRSNSSPRRFIDAMARKISPYDDFDNQDLKSKTLDELLETISEYKKARPEDREKYQETLAIMAGFLKGFDHEEESYHWQDVMKRVLFYLGLKGEDLSEGEDIEGKEKKVDYIITKDGVTLTEKGMLRIIELMENYKTNQKWKLGYKRQNHPALEV